MLKRNTLDMLYKITVRSVIDYALPIYANNLNLWQRAVWNQNIRDTISVKNQNLKEIISVETQSVKEMILVENQNDEEMIPLEILNV